MSDEIRKYNTGLSEAQLATAFQKALASASQTDLNDLSDSITASLNLIVSNQELVDTAQNTLIKQLLDDESKNVISIRNLVTESRGGITFTPNASDGTITVSGTPNLSSYPITYNIVTMKIPSGNWVFVGCPSGGSNDTFRVSISNAPSLPAYDTGDGVEFVGGSNFYSVIRIDINSSFDGTTPVVFRPMLCRKEAYELSATFKRNAPSKDVLGDNISRIGAACKELVDNGAKNKVSVNSGSTPAGGGYFVRELPISLEPGDYVFKMKRSSTTTTSTSMALYDENNTQVLSMSAPATTTDLTYQFYLPSAATKISIYVGYSVDVSDVMICTLAAYNVSNKFVPYRPSWDEMYAMIQALQTQSQSVQSTNSLMSLRMSGDGDASDSDSQPDWAIQVDEVTDTTNYRAQGAAKERGVD